MKLTDKQRAILEKAERGEATHEDLVTPEGWPLLKSRLVVQDFNFSAGVSRFPITPAGRKALEEAK